jgi:hypothetical protein
MAVRSLHVESAILKGCIGKTMTKGEEGLGAPLAIPAIAHKDAFCIADTLSPTFIVVVGIAGVVFQTPFKRHRKLARRVDIAKENVAKSSASFLAREPGIDDGRHAVDPRGHVDITARCNHSYNVFIYGKDFVDQGILGLWQKERLVHIFPLEPVIKAQTEDHSIRPSSNLFCVLKRALLPCSDTKIKNLTLFSNGTLHPNGIGALFF